MGEWDAEIEFWAYDRARPGTQMIWVCCQDGPARRIFVKGENDHEMEGWRRVFQFWVPV